MAQQTTTVTGTVIDDFGDPLIGVTVQVVEESGIGAATNLDGQYTLKNVPTNATLRFSYVGFATLEEKLNGRTVVDVVLKEDVAVLSEVVVTGYGGKQSRAKVTASIAKVSDERLSVGVHSNPAQALSGAVSGLRVVQTSGNPGSTPTIVLRGGTNLNGTGSPLVLVDGQLRSSLSDINPEDIESINVLKDAGATALYGARASNGVILVTTKTGKAGSSDVNVKVRFGLNYINSPHKFLETRDYLTYMRRAYVETPWADRSGLTGGRPFGTGNVYGPAMQWNLMNYDASLPLHADLLKKGGN